MCASETVGVVPVRVRYAVWFGPEESDIFDCEVGRKAPDEFVLDPAADYFQFYDRMVVDLEVEERGTLRLVSPRLNESPYYVPGGLILEGEERAAAFAPGGPLANIGSREDDIVVRSRYRTLCFGAQTGVVVLPAPPTQ